MIQTTVRSILESRTAPTLSLEFYPPKSPLGFGILGGSIERMRAVRPDFTTCTYGAGGSTRENSFAAWELLERMGFTPVVAHLTCVGATRAQLEEQIHRIHAAGIRNIMALRGDPPRGETAFRVHEGGLAHLMRDYEVTTSEDFLSSTRHHPIYHVFVCSLAFSHHKNVGYLITGTVSVWFTALASILYYRCSKHLFQMNK